MLVTRVCTHWMNGEVFELFIICHFSHKFFFLREWDCISYIVLHVSFLCLCTELIQCIYCMSCSTPHAGHAGWRYYSLFFLIPYRNGLLGHYIHFPLSGLIHFFGTKKCCTCIHPLYETSHRLHGSCACHIFFCTAGIQLVITRGLMLWKEESLFWMQRHFFRLLLKQL